MRAALYRMARWLGDANALRRGKYVGRATNKVIGRNVVGRLWRR